jgi:hypothetical protein
MSFAVRCNAYDRYVGRYSKPLTRDFFTACVGPAAGETVPGAAAAPVCSLWAVWRAR